MRHDGRVGLRALALAAAIGASATVASAQSDATAGEPDGAEPGRVELLDLGWRAGPTYAIGWLDRPEDPATGVRGGVGLTGRIGGQLAVDGGYLGGSALADEWDGVLRRGRIETTGELTLWRETDYKFEFGFQRNDFYLHEAWLRRRFHGFVDALKVGYFSPPVSLEGLASSTALPLMETAAPVAAFSPTYGGGVELDGTASSPDLTWALNASTVGQVIDDRNASSEPVRAAGRLVWRPWFEPAAPTPTLLHLGANVVGGLGSGELQYRARPESYLAPFVLDTGKFDGDAVGADLEVAWQRGPLSVQGEVFELLASPEHGGSLAFQGAYVEVVHTLTGEARPYDRDQAIFGRLAPRRPLDPARGQWGAFELAGRLSWLDLSDGPIHGGRMLAANAGVTWTWNAHVRLQAGYVYARVRDRPDAGSGHVLQARLELRF